jgi:YD repeat-containing protein
MTYDAAGNITNDGVNTYTYDGENRIVAVNSNSAVYAYDAEVRRVRKYTRVADYEYCLI